MYRPHHSARPSLRRAAPAFALLVAGLAFAACNPGSSTTPSLVLPSIAIPSGLGGSLGLTGSGVTGCVDPATAAILSQLQAQGADVPTLLDQNKDALANGLASFAPADPNVVTWRDKLVAAIRGGDMTTATAQIQLLASGQVSVATC